MKEEESASRQRCFRLPRRRRGNRLERVNGGVSSSGGFGRRFPIALRGIFARPTLFHCFHELISAVIPSRIHIVHRLADRLIQPEKLTNLVQVWRVLLQFGNEIVDVTLQLNRGEDEVWAIPAQPKFPVE